MGRAGISEMVELDQTGGKLGGWGSNRSREGPSSRRSGPGGALTGAGALLGIERRWWQDWGEQDGRGKAWGLEGEAGEGPEETGPFGPP